MRWQRDLSLVKRYCKRSVYQFMLLNPTQKPLNNLNIRKALSLAMDRENPVECQCKVPTNGLLPPGVTGVNKSFREEYPKPYMQKNITLAKQLLKKGMEELKVKKLPTLTILSSPDSLNYYWAVDLKAKSRTDAF